MTKEGEVDAATVLSGKAGNGARTDNRPSYAAPALEKGLDILETLCRSDAALSQKEIAERLGRSVGEVYRMIMCLVDRGYLANADDRFSPTTKLFELAHVNPPTHRLLSAAAPVMQKLSDDLDQSCHLTVYSQGRQIVVAKVDSPSGIGFSVRVGAELDVLVSASGRVLLAFAPPETREMRIVESLRRRPEHIDPQIGVALASIKVRGFESMPSNQVRGLYAASFPILDTQGHGLAALTVPYAERIDQVDRTSIMTVEQTLGAASRVLSTRMGGSAHYDEKR